MQNQKNPILPLFSQILYKVEHVPPKLIYNHLQVMADNNRTLYLPQAHSYCDVLQNTISQRLFLLCLLSARKSSILQICHSTFKNSIQILNAALILITPLLAKPVAW